jgi:hypothetical protein
MDNFIGKTFPTPKGGTITIIDKLPNVKGKPIKYLCECSICSKDKELFPNHFQSVKSSLTGGKKNKPQIPCGCAKTPCWNEEQYKILVSRKAASKNYTFLGWSGEFKNALTKLVLFNPLTSNLWSTTTLDSFVNGGTEDPHLYKNTRLIPEYLKLLEVEQICDQEGLTFLGWGDKGYVGHYTKFRWLCKEKHLCDNTILGSFLIGTRCMTCHINSGNNNGYYQKRCFEEDYLYVMDFYDYIKVGRSFRPNTRAIEIKANAELDFKPDILQLYTANHSVVYDIEQSIHYTLREGGFQYSCSWTKECFTKSSYNLLQTLLDNYITAGSIKIVDKEYIL